MTYPPPQDPWRGQAPPPPPPPHQQPTAKFDAVPPYPMGQYPAAPPRQSWWRRLSRGAQVAIVTAGVLVLCCCGGVAIGAVADSPADTGKKDAAPATSAPNGGEAAAPAPAVADVATPTAAASTTEAAPSESPSPQVETRIVTTTEKIAYSTRTVKDSSLAEGTKKIRTRGAAGVRTLTYQVTVTDGVQTGKKLVRSVVTKAPVTQVIAVGTKQTRQCDPNYSGACVPIASDVDCAGGSGNGPAYVDGPVRVVGEDIYDLDRDGDGIACDT
ncbi:G5 domain-containing protein [Micromonospora sp. NPDC004551]|uniref:G5 domain-containing protein n=1 Tax=Micromonospora sp. NPDC004551 TaxID=3154284 RepID=UPI0033A7FDAE